MLAHATEPDRAPARALGADAQLDASARAFLRLRSLHFWHSIVGHDVEFAFAADGGHARGVFAGVDAREREYCVEALATPLGVARAAKIRSSDVMSITVNMRRSSESSDAESASDVAIDRDGDAREDDAEARSASESEESWLDDA